MPDYTTKTHYSLGASLTIVVLWGCSGTSTVAPSSGGGASNGGSSSTGTTNALGGSGPTGAASSIGGGATSSGGAMPTGGSMGAGGEVTTGGAATGGAATGGSAKGGASSTGGAATGGSAKGGDSSTGGSSTAGGSGNGSPGCKSASPLASGTFTINVTTNGTAQQRSYILDVPTNYDTNHPYRLIFTLHWLGGSAKDVVNQGYYGLKSLANNSAIFVSPDGLNGTAAGITGQGWYNTNGEDMDFIKAMLAYFNANLCIDQERIFSTGFSYGGMMSIAIGCEMADVFRAIAPMSGNAQGSGCKQPNQDPIAYWGAHGDQDTFVTTDSGAQARDIFVKRNGCSSTTTPGSPSECVNYTGCKDGYPVIWCEFSGSHQIWSGSPQPLWAFLSQF